MAKKKNEHEYFSRPVKIAAGMVVLLAGYVYQLPLMIQPTKIMLPPLPDAPEDNNKLAKMQHLYRKMDGAEKLVFKGDTLYTGLVDGQVVKLDTSQGRFAQIEGLAFTGDPERALPFPCGKFNTQPICGRPLAVDLLENGKLVIADAYFGLMRLDPTSGKLSLLAKKPDDDRLKKFKFLKDLVVAKDSQNIYFTESSSLRQLRLSMYEQFEGRTFGRLFKYDAKKRKATTMLSNLAFPTGLVVDKDEKYLLVAERAKARISRIDLTKKVKKNTKPSIFANNLPVWPERITWDADGEHIWVAGHPRHTSSTMQWLAEQPELRSLLAKCLSPEKLEWFLSSGSMALRLDSNGKIVQSFTDYSGRTGVIAGVYPQGDDLWFSMFTNSNVRYLGKMTRQELGLESVEQST